MEVDKDLLLSKIKKEVKIKNLRVHEYFLDFDTLRKGFCAKNKFRGVLSQMKINLEKEEYDFLERVYENDQDPSKANWHQFSKDINLVFAEDELEKDPLRETKPYEIPKFLDPQTNLNKSEEA